MAARAYIHVFRLCLSKVVYRTPISFLLVLQKEDIRVETGGYFQ